MCDAVKYRQSPVMDLPQLHLLLMTLFLLTLFSGESHAAPRRDNPCPPTTAHISSDKTDALQGQDYQKPRNRSNRTSIARRPNGTLPSLVITVPTSPAPVVTSTVDAEQNVDSSSDLSKDFIRYRFQVKCASIYLLTVAAALSLLIIVCLLCKMGWKKQ